MNRIWISSGLLSLALGAGMVAGCGDSGASNLPSAASSPTAIGPAVATPASTMGGGKVRIVYDEAGVRPENLEAFRVVRQSGGLDRMASWVNERIALPADIVVRVTDAVPAGVTDASAEADGRTVWEPAFFLTETYQAARKLVPEVKAAGKVPSNLAEADFTPEAVLAGTTEFIFGHEMGHALMRVLDLPVLSFEEIQADGMAAFLTLNNPASGYRPAIQAAIVFDEFAAARGAPTVGDYASDHPIIQSRIYNFLCYAAGTDPDTMREPLIESGLVPEERSPFCALQWAQLDHGWWRVLEPHLSPSGQDLSAPERQRSAENYSRRFEEFKVEMEKLRAKEAGGG